MSGFESMKEKALLVLQKRCGALGVSVAISKDLFEIPSDTGFGDLAFPCFALAKTLKKSPADIATDLASSLSSLPKEIETVAATGPYVNFFFSPIALAQLLFSKKSRGIAVKKKKESLIIEYISPNTNKPLHLGHVRNAVLGESLAHLLIAQGKSVVTTCQMNDRGIHICKTMVAYRMQEQELKRDSQKMPTPSSLGIKSDHYVGNLYVLFEKYAKKNPALIDAAQECLKKWEAGDAKTCALWKKMNGWALAGMKQTTKRLGVTFDTITFESDIYDKGRDIILKNLKGGSIETDQSGAVIARLGSFGLPDKVLLRKDGTALYITQDIYLAYARQKKFGAHKILYVVGSEQNLYFKQLFAILRLLDFSGANEYIHVSYGMVNLPDGKMKSREGTVVDADDILDKLEHLIRKELEKRHKKLPQKEITLRAQRLALAALKFYMASVSPKSEMTFNPKESLSFEGKTGPYLLYTYARLKSILKKAGKSVTAKKMTSSTEYDWKEERQLLLTLVKYPDILAKGCNDLNPSAMADYLFTLSKGLNDYYHRAPILTAPSHERAARLALITLACDSLHKGLGLLGIQTLERM